MDTKIRLALCVLMILGAGLGCKMISALIAKSGTEFKIQVETNEGDKVSVIEQAIKVTQNKLKLIKLNGEAVGNPDDPTQFIVRIYDPKDLERVKKFLFTSYQLELRKVVSPPNPEPIKTYPTAEAARKAATSEQEIFPYKTREDSTEQFVIVEKSAIVNGDGIRDAQAVARSSNDYTINFSLKPQAATAFGEWTGRNINNYLAIVLDRNVQSVAYIKSQIFDSGEITGRFTKETADDIAMSLKSGYLPAKMSIVSEKHIGN